MTVFRRTAEALLSPVERNFAAVLAEQMKLRDGLTVSEAERRSWERSLPVVAHDLLEAGLGQVEMLIEYRLPLTSKRADVILAGVDRRTGGDAFVVVELKQWSRAEIWDDNPSRVLVHNMTGKPKLHPALQAKDYADYIAGYLTELAANPDALAAVAYLHNAANADVIDLYDAVEDDRTQLFTLTTRGAFVDYLSDRFAPLPGRAAADRFLDSAVRPSRRLLEHAAAEIRNRDQFVLLDEQRLAYQLVVHAVGKAHRSDLKTVVVITGGPGSGKSVIALSLLGELSQRGRAVQHATGSKSFTQTMRRQVAGKASMTQSVFKYFNSFTKAAKNDLDALICDEAHRIRRVSGNPSPRSQGRRLQIDELIDAARVPVFLLDGQQNVRPGEMGTLPRIREHAKARGLDFLHVSLDEQFRCGGSRKYEDWVLRLLGLRPEPPDWTGDEGFEVSVAASPYELEAALRARLADGRSARITAGFCWPWSNPRRRANGKGPSLVPDVVVDGWSRPWNVKGDEKVGDAPPSDLWATDPGGFEQVGCVYTAQGFEYDWNGVILGPDLVYRNGRLVTVRQASRDPALRNQDVSDREADELIRNTYKVLLTRGMVGTILYSTDPETRAFLAGILNAPPPGTPHR
ncbi:DUF2075 domain-containing protein [Actinomadura viridis]|uniref:AAA+ ATPase domain-containing protein n=1 Tax=Actinomadura viridis TaxID=58110 RepID=A0A931GL53_9ACTN|nr:DUF2075 domain-containing protein [Actinomadura viridis]MBG6090770.1 hypothetical protein [Actinomadura viridis]